MTSTKKTLLQSVEDSCNPFNRSELDPYETALYLIDVLYHRGKNLEQSEESIKKLASIARAAINSFELLSFDNPGAKENMLRKSRSYPIEVSKVHPPSDKRRDKGIPYNVQEALKLPIGEDLLFKVPNKTKGRRSIDTGWMYHLIVDVIYPIFLEIREGLKDHALAKEIRALPDLKKRNISEWVPVMAKFIDEMDWSIEDPDTWLHKTCKGRAMTLLNRSKNRRIRTINKKLSENDPGNEDILISKKERILSEGLSRSFLISALKYQFGYELKKILEY